MPVSASLSETVSRFAGMKVLVIGDAMLDIYTRGVSRRICPEAPVPVIDVVDEQLQAGGAANTAANLASLGAGVSFLSAIGDDCQGLALLELLSKQGIDTSPVCRLRGRQTLAKQRIIAESQMVVRFDCGGRQELSEEAERCLIESIDRLETKCDAIVVSDYGYGVLSRSVIDRLSRLRTRPILAVDSKQLPRFASAQPDVVKPNCREALALLGVETPPPAAQRIDTVAARGDELLELTGARTAVVTFDRDGCLCIERGKPPIRVAAPPCTLPRVAGAGDTFLSALTLALASGTDGAQAAQIANLAASVVVEKDLTATCSSVELLDRICGEQNAHTDLARLSRLLDAQRERGKRIVLTNGCFDILHRGHVTYLRRARALGDLLVVGVNSDESIKRLKGPTRPINTLVDRLGVLAALDCVDYLVAFEEDTPHRLIEAIRPDVFVKGGDYTRETLPEADLVEQLGGEVRILSLVADRSTTNIINRIRHHDEPMGIALWSDSRNEHVPASLGASPQHFVR
jgi:D-beta-D-heptose 7-phosphate kinase / D-beta-D-heptose 1-phosphate adenosyltransferase